MVALLASASLVACGGDGDDDDDGVALPAVTIRGALDSLLPSGAIPTSVLPSSSLDSGTLNASASLAGTVTSFVVGAVEPGQRVGAGFAGDVTGAGGTASFDLDSATGDFSGSVTIAGLEVPMGGILTVQLYTGFAGENGPGFLNLDAVDLAVEPVVFEVPAGTMLTPEQQDAILEGSVYISTEIDSAMALRGQIVPPDTQVARVALGGAQVVPAADGAAGSAAGVGYLTFNTADETVPVVANLALSGFDASSVTLNSSAPAGLVGPADLTLAAGGGPGADFSVNGSAVADLEGLTDAEYYFSAVDGDGAELRGQVLPTNYEAVQMTLTEGQVVGADTVAGGSARAFFTFDSANAVGADDGNPDANNPVVVVETDFEASAARVVVGGGVAGMNGTADRIELTDVTGDGFSWVANVPVDSGLPGGVSVPQTADGDLQSIAGLGGLLAGVYSVEAEDSTGAQLRAQVTPGGLQVVQIDLTGSQVIGADSVEGGTARAFVTFDSSNATTGDANPLANNNPIVTATTSFPAAAVEVFAGGGFAGRNGTATPITLTDSGDGMNFSANLPGTAEASLQSIASLPGLLNGVYYMQASDAGGNQLRGQITPAGTQVIEITLEEAQVVEAGSIASGFARAFFTVDETNSLGSGATADGEGSADGNPMANNPVVVVNTSIPVAAARVVVGGGFAGLLGSAERIVLQDTGSGMDFEANAPGTAVEDLRSIGNLAGLMSGVYYIEVEDADGNQLRGQILPAGTGALRADISGLEALPADDEAVGTGVGNITVTNLEAGLFVANARFTDFTVDTATVNVGGANNMVFADLSASTAGTNLFTTGDAQAANNANGILNGAYSIEATGTDPEPEPDDDDDGDDSPL